MSVKRILFVAALCCATAAGAGRPIYAPLLPIGPVDPQTVPMPDLAFTPTAEIEQGYPKYFFFHRDNTSFATGYQDIRECDQLSRQMNDKIPAANVPYPYAGTMVGAAGGLLGALIVDATAGAAQRRSMRRDNMRTCMTFKEYQVYGLPKNLWAKFNFQEGMASPPDGDREVMLRRQARAATGPKPQIGELR